MSNPFVIDDAPSFGGGCSLMGLGREDDRLFTMEDYEGPVARWCSGCGDHSVLTAVQKLLVGEQLKPETTVFVSGIGCSSRFPHYVKTYGFHGIHGRALPLSTGVKLSRPDLDVFVVMGDGDCVSIGAGHWIHATRYNVDMVALLLDNNIYGLTKKQTSPTTPQGYGSNTQPRGSYLPAMNPLEATLGVTNASFVAQTAEWLPAHLYATLEAAYRHRGFSFVRILQRCPHFTPDMYGDAVKDPSRVELLVHDDGIQVPQLEKMFEHKLPHDPGDLDRARTLAEPMDVIRIGLFYHNESRPRYEETRHLPRHGAGEKIALLQEEFDRYAV
ncbi:MAG: thiamine pyrophosphate-dependent enzyme [Gemmatimonadota bacterium]|jgi:2-oxoglutarate ferredoxin oxidoreductase subunit beta